MSTRARTKTVDLGVDWHLPAKPGSKGGAYAKRRFATTTPASSNLIGLLAGEGLTWAELVGEINFDDEAKAVAQAFVDAGHGETKAAEHLSCHSAVPVRERSTR